MEEWNGAKDKEVRPLIYRKKSDNIQNSFFRSMKFSKNNLFNMLNKSSIALKKYDLFKTRMDLEYEKYGMTSYSGGLNQEASVASYYFFQK